MAIFSFLFPTPIDFNFGECLWFLDRGFDDCLYRLDKSSVTRVIRLEEGLALFQVEMAGTQLQISILNRPLSQKEVIALKNYISDWFDLQLELDPFYQLIAKEPRLAFMKEEYFGLRMVGIPDLFEAICWAIIGQQINLTFAYQLKRKLVEGYGERMEFNDHTYFLFPTPEVLATVAIEDLQGMQFSRSKASYLLGIAQAFADQSISKERLSLLPDVSSRQKFLTDIKGVGPWTANYALMKSLKERSCIPHGDAGLLNALIHLEIIQDKKDTVSIAAFFSEYIEWESYLVFYLWRTLSKRT
ncbi:DNA-3-methyladenine glycosylase family protein [Pedobacter gandavensis]|uniref:DNA-3-methyladenine glycosylase family protein n=1 Tax=Pedobacter gandavensis TaxID=2679963 RepID=UPI00292F3B73|nr:DNA glycosylase [Pedobacter gandavensis]